MRRDGDFLFYTIAAAVAGVGFIVADHLSTPYDALFDAAGKRHGLDPNLLRAIGRKESGFRADAVSKPNANGTRDYGVMQINENTAKALGVPRDALMNPGISIETAGRLLTSLKQELGEKLTINTLIAAYNAGSPAIKRRGIFNIEYVSEVMTHLQLYSLGRIFKP